MHIKDMLAQLEELNPSLLTIKRELLVVPEMMSLEKLLMRFRARRGHLVLVVDEFGASAGIVTLQDVIAEVLGPLPDEFGLEHQPGRHQPKTPPRSGAQTHCESTRLSGRQARRSASKVAYGIRYSSKARNCREPDTETSPERRAFFNSAINEQTEDNSGHETSPPDPQNRSSRFIGPAENFSL